MSKYPWVQKLFPQGLTPSLRAGKLKYHLRNWKSLTHWSRNIKHCSRASNSISIKTKTSTPTTASEVKQRRGGLSGKRNRENARERGNQKDSKSYPETIIEFNFSSSKERLGVQSGDKLKEAELTHRIPSFQNGKSVTVERTTSGGGFLLQVRSEGCIFLSTSPPPIPKVCEFQMYRRHFSVSLPIFGLGPAPSVFTILMKPCNVNKYWNSPSKRFSNLIPRCQGSVVMVSTKPQVDKWQT